MKVLLIGGGGREHALGWKIAQSPLLERLYLAPGAPGLNRLGTPAEHEGARLGAGDVSAIAAFARAASIDLVVVGPEAPLADGLADRLESEGVPCFGPSKEAARLETSKAFAKEICNAAGAPTAAYGRFHALAPARAFLAERSPPYVVKADGLAAGKGVVIAETAAAAETAVSEMLAGKYGPADGGVVIEDFLRGEEASFFALTDGEAITPLIAVQDHKRAFDGDKGPNTGGMGAYAPTAVFTEGVREQTLERIVRPVINEMAARGTPYKGVLYVGLMIDNERPSVVEFNARFGDPECQVMMRLMKSDLLPLLYAAATGDLKGRAAAWRAEAAALVVMAADGYPGAYEKGALIEGVDAAEEEDGVVVFQAGTREDDGRLFANGGRVLNVTAVGPDIETATARAYTGVRRINWPTAHYRRDIAWRALERGRAAG